MGYDMYIETEVAGESEAVEAADKIYRAALAKRDGLPEEFKGSVLTEEHQALPKEEQAPFFTAYQDRITKLNNEGEDFFVARFLRRHEPEVMRK